MSARRLAAALWLFTAVLLQLAIVNRLGLPLGVPNLALLTVICLALLDGPAAGMAYGFSAGLLGDLLGTHTVGRLALVWTLLGYAVGLLWTEDPRESRSALMPLAVVGAGSLLATIGYAALGVLVREPHAPVGQLLGTALATMLYNLLLAPFWYPPLRGLLSQLDPSQV